MHSGFTWRKDRDSNFKFQQDDNLLHNLIKKEIIRQQQGHDNLYMSVNAIWTFYKKSNNKRTAIDLSNYYAKIDPSNITKTLKLRASN